MQARIVQAILVGLVNIINEWARQSTFSLIVPMAKELGLDEAQRGQLMFAYFNGYLWMQVPSGMLAQRIGGTRTYSAMMLLLTASFFVVPLAATLGFGQLWLALFLVGFVAAPTTPVSGIILNEWFPRSERSAAVAIRDFCCFIGGISSLLLSPLLAEQFGWAGAYRIFGSASFLALLAWAAFAAPDAESCSYATPEERAFLRQHLAPSGESAPKQSAPSSRLVLRLFSFPAVWAVIFSHAVHNYVRAVWAFFPTYFQESLGANAQQAGNWLAVADAFALMGRPLAAWWDRDRQGHGHSLLSCRRFFSVGGFLFQAAVLMSIAHLQSPMAVAVALGVGSLGGALHTAGYRANYLDQTTELQGALGGVGNTLATLPGVFTGRIVTYLRHAHCRDASNASECLQTMASWAPAWYSIVGAELLAAAFFWQCASCVNLDLDKKKRAE